MWLDMCGVSQGWGNLGLCAQGKNITLGADSSTLNLPDLLLSDQYRMFTVCQDDHTVFKYSP